MNELVLSIGFAILACNAAVVAWMLRKINRTIFHMLKAAKLQNQMLILLFMLRK